MNQSDIHLLDLPNEMLISILKKLNNIDVLYSLIGINNYRLYKLAIANVFTNTLNFVTTSSTDSYNSISDTLIDRFCVDILPQIGQHIQYLILDSHSMERILLATHYPNLTKLKFFNFGHDILLRYFTDDSTVRDIFKQQITDLVLVNNDDNHNMITSLETYTTNVYAHILTFFERLKHLTLIASSNNDYPPLCLSDEPSSTFHSTILTQLSINVSSFDDCFALLDRHLKQLSTFIVKMPYITNFSSIVRNTDDLPTLKVFSLTCCDITTEYENQVVPLVRRMSCLEKLTLYLRVRDRDTFIDGTHLYNDILLYMPRLYSFIFYIGTINTLDGYVRYLSDEDVQRTFINIGYQQVACIVNYFRTFKAICHTFSLPFTFNRLEKIANKFPNIIFNTVTYLKAYDVVPFKHEFFQRIAQAFPLLKDFCIMNYMPRSQIDNQLYSVIEYPHLTLLDVKCVHTDYIEQFLLETKAYLPRLIELKVNYDQLRNVTHDFTREITRRNCVNIKRLIIEDTIAFQNEVSIYFASL